MLNTVLIGIIGIYILFFVAAIVFEINKIKHRKVIGMVTLCNIMYLFIVVIIPVIIFIGYISGASTSTLIRWEDKYAWTFIIGTIYTILVYVMFNFGTKVKQREFKQKEERTKHVNVLILSSIYLLVSIVCLYLYASGYGGIMMLLENANYIRAGWISSTNGLAFFKHFILVSMLSSYMLFQYLFIKKDYKKKYQFVIGILEFIFSVFITLIYMLANDGRLLMGFFILIFFLIIIKNNYENKGKKLAPIICKSILLIIILMLIIIYGDAILNLMRGNIISPTSTSSLGQTITKEFSFIITGLQSALINESLSSYTIFNDIVNGLFAWLPTVLKPIQLTDVWDYNTYLINPNSIGQSPTSIVAQSYYDLGIIGLVCIPLLYGVLVRRVEKYLESYGDDIFATSIYCVLGIYFAKGMAYFSMSNIMLNIFFIVLGIILYSIVKRIRIK